MSDKNEGFNKEKFFRKGEGKLEDKYGIIKEKCSGVFPRCLKSKK